MTRCVPALRTCLFPALVSGALLLLCSLPASAQEAVPAPPRTVTLHQCLEEAMQLNPGIRGSGQGIEAAEAHRKSVRGSFGPSVMVTGSVRVWDEETVADFGGAMGAGGMDLSLLPEPTTIYETILAEMLKGFGKPTVVQEQVTSQFGATVVQPITPLLTVLRAYQLAGLAIDEARLKETETRMNVALAVVNAYFGLQQARAVLSTLETSVLRVKAHREQMEKLFDADLVGRSDVLKIKVAEAELGQALVQTRNMVELARANLAIQVGWGPMTQLRVEPLPHTLPALPTVAMAESIRQALTRRPELHAMKVRKEQAELGRKVVQHQYIPVVTAMGSYVYNQGSTFMDEHSFFVGVDLNWTLWEWGRTHYAADEAAARMRQVEYALAQVRDYVSLEVQKAVLDLQSALEEYAAVQVRVAEAEENYRVQQKLYEAEYKTSTDLIDAEAAMTEAHAQRDLAFYKVWTAKAAFGKAVGDPIASWYQAPAAH